MWLSTIMGRVVLALPIAASALDPIFSLNTVLVADDLVWKVKTLLYGQSMVTKSDLHFIKQSDF